LPVGYSREGWDVDTGCLAINDGAVGAQACYELMPSLRVRQARLGPKNEPANATKLQGPERNSRTHRCSASRLKFDVTELHHVRAGLHQPPAHYREVLGCAELEAQD